MLFIIGTKSHRKIETVKKILQQILEETKFELVSFDAPSNVCETPWNKETYEGARNRANGAFLAHPKAEYAIGIESGLVKRYGQIYEEAWCCVIDKSGKEFFGYSSGLKVPDYILKKMDEHKLLKM